MIVEIILLVCLIIFSIIDLKVKAIPSIFLTGLIFVLSIVNIGNIQFGIVSLILALLLKESDFIGGMADIKIIVMVGLIISSIQEMMIFTILLMTSGLAYKIVLKYVMKSNEKEIAFIPAITFAYLFFLINQGVLIRW